MNRLRAAALRMADRDAWRFGAFERVLLATFFMAMAALLLTLTIAVVGEHGNDPAGFDESVRAIWQVFMVFIVVTFFGRPIGFGLYHGAVAVKRKVTN